MRAFEAVSRNGSFVGAARELHVTQSALSETIKNLEEAVGIRLLERSTRRVGLSAPGKDFLVAVQHILNTLDGAVLQLEQLTSLSRGEVRVVGATSALSCLVAPCLAHLQVRAPNIRFEMRTSLGADMLKNVREGHADFCIGAIADDALAGDIESLPLLHDQFGVVAARGHRVLAPPAGATRLGRLTQPTYIGLTIHSMIDTFLTGSSDTPEALLNPRIRVDGTGSLAALLVKGIGFSILPALVLQQLDLPSLEFRPLADPGMVRTIRLARVAGRELSPAAQALWDQVQSVLPTFEHVPGIRLAARGPVAARRNQGGTRIPRL